MHQLKRIAPRTTGEALDQYITKPEVVRRCLEVLGDLGLYDLVIEPSAGTGVFLHAIEHGNKIGLDIDPKHPDVIQADWFEYRVPQACEHVLVVGNPPYGRYHKLSSRFIRHAMSFGNVQTIAFILPNVYRKHTRQRIIPGDWRIVSILDLGRDCFTLDGSDYHVPTSFFVLDHSKGPDLRVQYPGRVTGTRDFDFATRRDFDVFVFGAAPTRVIRNPTPNNRGHFLKARIPVPTLIERVQSVDWQGNSCAKGGVYWLTKHEFVEQYRACHENDTLSQREDF